MWENLKNTVNNVIKPNDNREITGEKHNNTLSAVINSLGKYSQFAGLAFKNTNPGVPDGPVFYFAAFKGVYINFNRIEVKENEVAILNYNNNKWGKIVIGYSPIAPATAEDIRLTAFIDAVNDNNALKTNFEFKQDSIADVQLPFLHAAVSHIDADGQLIKGKPTSEVLIPVPLAEPSIDVDTPGKHGFMSYQDKDLLDSIPNYTISGKKISENPILTHDDIQGVAYLGEDGKIPSSLLPSYVDDVIEYDSIDNFPLIGEGGKIYLDKKTNLAYRWSGTTYVSISSSIALGETSSTAYAGDKGKKNAEDIADLKTNKADKTSVYTKEEVDYLLEHFKLPDHIKAITFSVDGILLSKNENGDLVIGGNVVVEGGISMYGPGQFGDSIMDYIIVDNKSIKIIDGKLTVDPNFVGGSTVKGIKVNGYTYDEVDTNGYITIPDYPTELAWNSITGKPSTFTPSAHTHKIEDITDIADASVSHATTADRLKKEIKIWGQPFDGSTDVEGAISNVDVINMANADTVISLYIKDNVLFIDGDLAVTGGITMYASDGVTSGLLDQVYAILDSSKFEIKNGVITIKGDIGDGKVKGATLGGVAVALNANGILEFDAYPTTLPASDVYAWAKAATKPTYSWGEITDKPSTFTPSSHTHTFASLTSKPTTLSGYGITDAYTKTEVNTKLTDGSVTKIGTKDVGSVTLPIYLKAGVPTACNTTLGVSITGNSATATKLANARTLWGQSFDGSENVSGDMTGVGTITPTGEDLKVVGNLIVTGGIVMYADDGATIESGFAALLAAHIDGVTIKYNEAQQKIYSVMTGIKVNGTTYKPSETDGYITIPDYPTSLDWENIENKPSTFTPASHTHTFASLTSKPTTLSGYGITDAKIANGVITLGTATITPLTAHQKVTLASGTNNGTLKLTVGSTTTDNIAVKGLGSAAYTEASAYATAGHTHSYAGSASAGGAAYSANKVNSRGNLTAYAEGSTTMGESGVNLYTVYNNGYPVAHGNLLHIYGLGAGQLLAEWCGSSTLGHLYYRSKRDNSNNGWSAWGKVAFVTDNVASASKWATARKITLTGSVTGEVSIDGSGNVTLATTTNHTHSYVPLSGGTMSGNLILKGGTSADMTYAGNVHPSIRFDNSDSSQNVSLIFTDYDSYRAPAGLKLVGNQGNEWFEAADIYATTFHGALSGNATTATTASKLGTANVGSGTQHFYLNAGTATASTSTVGGTAKPMYLNAGVMTAISATVGSTSLPVYLNAGTITACSTTLGVSVTGNAATATTLQTARTLWGQSFNGSANISGNMSGVGQITFSALSGTNGRALLYQQMADNDFFRIYAGGTGNNGGYVEIATADDGNEPIYVRQYSGVFGTLVRTLTLLDGNGNTTVPGLLTAANGTVNGTLKVGAIPVTNSSSGVLKIDGNLIVTGGITMYATDGVASGLMEQILVDGTTIGKKADGTLYAINTGNVRSIVMGSTTYTPNDSGAVTLPEKVTWANIEGKPSTFAPSAHTHSYLPLAGGTLTGALTIDFNHSGGGTTSSLLNVLFNGTHDYGVVAKFHSYGGDSPAIRFSHSSNKSEYNSQVNTNWSVGMRASTYTDFAITQDRGTSGWGTVRFAINNSGNVGIGVDSASYKLHVAGDIYTTTGFKKNGSSDSYVLLGGGGHKAVSDFATSGHTHNYLPLSGGTMSGYISAPGKGIIFYGSVGATTGAYITGSSEGVYINGYKYVTLESASVNYHPRVRLNTVDYPLLSTYNYNSYVPTLTGTGASGTWGISITGNAASATKLTSSAGSATLPIYFSDGKPVACTASSVFSNLSNSGNNISVTVAGQNRTLTVRYATTSSMLKTDYWNGGVYVSSDTHYMCLGYMNCTNSYDALTLLVTSAFWGNQHGSQDIITIQQDTNTNGTKTVQPTVGRLRLGGSHERTFYYYKDNTNLRLYLYVYVTGGNSYGKWNISYLGGNATWVSATQTNVTKNDSWVAIGYSGQINYASSAGSAGNADKVDGYHATDGRTFNGNINWGSWNDTWSDGTNKHPWYGFDHRYPNTGAYSTTIADFFGMTIKTSDKLRLDFGTLLLNGTSIYSINVASSSKWQTARKITLTGSVTGSVSIDGSGNVTLATTTNHTHSYLPLAGGTMTGQIQRAGQGSSWIKGRDNAMIRVNSVNGYSVLSSIKTTNGSWEIGHYSADSHKDNLLFGYYPDSNYTAGTNSGCTKVTFTSGGQITATQFNGALNGNAATASAVKDKTLPERLTYLNYGGDSITSPDYLCAWLLDSSYNREIRTIAPSSVLTLIKALPLAGGTMTGSILINGTVDIGSASSSVRYIHSVGLWSGSGSALTLGANDTNMMRFLTNGNVGIGTMTPTSKLHVSGDILSNSLRVSSGADAKIVINNTDNDTYWSYIEFQQGGTAYGTLGTQGSKVLKWTGGDFLVSGGITMYSDLRKKNILSNEVLSVKEIAAAPLFRHTYKSDDNQYIHVGTSAQYWSGIHEDWFTRKDSEGYYQMELQNLGVAMGISLAREIVKYESKTDKKIRLMRKKINDLEARIKELEGSMEERRTA